MRIASDGGFGASDDGTGSIRPERVIRNDTMGEQSSRTNGANASKHLGSSTFSCGMPTGSLATVLGEYKGTFEDTAITRLHRLLGSFYDRILSSLRARAGCTEPKGLTVLTLLLNAIRRSPPCGC
jgi:hypothetical protein